MSQEGNPEDPEELEDQEDIEDQEEFETGPTAGSAGVAWYGRLLGLLIVGGGLALGAKFASLAGVIEFCFFLLVVLTPVGI